MDDLKWQSFLSLYDDLIRQGVRSHISGKENAEEALALIYYKLVRNEAMLDRIDEDHTTGYVYRTVRSGCVDVLRRNRHAAIAGWPKVPDQTPCPSAEDIVCHQSDYEHLVDQILRLPDIYGIPMVLKGICELSCEEIAFILDLKPETVRKRLERGRKMLLKEGCLNE